MTSSSREPGTTFRLLGLLEPGSRVGNIIASNTGHGIYVAIGTGGTTSSDWDCVWNNSAANYQGLTAGNNSISVDPLFVSATDVHLTAASPCIDAMPATWLTTAIATDADEFTEVRLSIVGTPRIGSTFGWMVAANQARTSLFAVSFRRGNTFFAPLGNLLLDQTAVLVTVFSAPGGFAFTVPNNPLVAGVTVNGQNLVLAPTGPGGQFTNVASITVY